jgi:hypothetical protein
MGEYIYRTSRCLVHSRKELRRTLPRAFQEIQSSLFDQVGVSMHVARLAFNAAVSSSRLVVAAHVASETFGQKAASPSALSVPSSTEHGGTDDTIPETCRIVCRFSAIENETRCFLLAQGRRQTMRSKEEVQVNVYTAAQMVYRYIGRETERYVEQPNHPLI